MILKACVIISRASREAICFKLNVTFLCTPLSYSYIVSSVSNVAFFQSALALLLDPSLNRFARGLC